MAETIRIEIPVNVVDNTSSGTASVTRNLTAMEKAFERAERMAQRFQRRTGVAAEIEIGAEDNATPILSAVENATEQVDGETAQVEVSVDDSATQVVGAASDAVENFDGETATATISADDEASPIVERVRDEIDGLSGETATPEIGVDDNATQIIDMAMNEVTMFGGRSAEAILSANDYATPIVAVARDTFTRFDGRRATATISVDDEASPIAAAARDAVENFDGTSGDAEIGADDQATPVIRAAQDAAESWNGSVFEAVVKITDVATSPIGAAIDAVQNPIAQAGSALGVSVGLVDTINTYKDFESMMSQVQAISGATGAEFDALKAKAQEMGATTKFTATESAEAFNYMAMAGWKTDAMLDGISGIMSLAAASGEDLGTTSDIVTDALTAFGLQASDSTHFADVLAQASANANTNVSMLGESFKYVAPVAGAMNYSVEDTSLALGLMANASIKGSMAGTALKTSLANMAAPTDNMAAAMEKYGISLTDSEGNMKSLRGVMDNLRSSLGGLSETEQTAAASTIFGKEAMAGMLAIINASTDDYNKLASAVDNADGASQRMADTMLDNVEGSLTLMQSAVEGVQNTFGERLSPYVRAGIDMITNAMPGAQEAITSFMDVVDEKAAGVQRTIGSMMRSDEWKSAGIIGKIDIAWDTLIAEPFKEWAGGEGTQLIAGGISELFSSAAAILPGGQKAGLSSILSTMLLAKGTTSLIGTARSIGETLAPIASGISNIATAARTAPSIGAFFGDLGAMIPTAAKFGIAAAAVTVAVVGIKAAVDKYNQIQLDNSLEEHFGNIKLSADEIKDVAAGILNQKYLTNVELALNEVQNADNLRDEAQKALESNDVLEFKSRVGIKLTADEQQDYTDNIETFVESKVKELESRTFAAHIHVQTYLGGTEEGQTLAQNIEKWATADYLELNDLSNQLSERVSAALENGIIGVREEAAISALQEKINNITARWKESEAQAQWDWINQKYGKLSAADLTSGSFTDLIEEMRSQRETAMESVQSDVTQWYAELNAMEKAGRITAEQNQHYQDMTGWYVRGQEGSELSKSLQLGSNTLNDAYGDKITGNIQTLTESAQNALKSAETSLQNGAYGMIGNTFDSMFQSLDNGHGFLGIGADADQSALNELYQSMKPDVSSMQSLIDQYRESGQAIPRSLMDGFNEAIKVGAAAGDEDAAWQNYANQIMESGSEEMKSVLTDPNNPMYESVRATLPEQFRDAIDRATAEVTDKDVTLEGLKASVDGDVDVDKDAWLSKIQEQLGDLGTVEGEVDGDIQIKVEKGDCLSQIGESLGVDWHEIAEYNGIEDPYTIYPDMELKIPKDSINVDTDGVGAAVEEATEVEPVEAETQANVTVVPGETDTSQVGETVQEDTSVDPVEAETTANVNITDATTEASGVVDQTTTDLETALADVPANAHATITIVDSTTVTTGVVEKVTSDVESAVSSVPANGHAEITLDQSNNASEIYSLTSSDVESAYAQTIPANGHTDVTLDQTNNVAEIYAECAGQVQSTFSQGFTASADVAVTLNWHITNPSAGITTSGSGSSVTASIAGNAEGSIVTGPLLSWVGEDGPEAIIPLGSKRRDRGMDLWLQAGRALGVKEYADGGMIGDVPLSGGSSDSTSGDSSGSGDKGQVVINMNPVFNINGDGGNDTINTIKEKLKELINEMSGELATRLLESYANMPT